MNGHVEKENTKRNIKNIHDEKHTYKTLYNKQQNKDLLFWLASASQEIQFAVMERINPSPYRTFLPPAEARMQALLLAIDTVRSAQVLTGRKSEEHSLAEHDAAHMLRVEIVRSMRGRRSPKREKIWMHIELIQKLFADNLSLRQVCDYLRRYAGLDINHSYLRKCCLELGVSVPGKRRAPKTHVEKDVCAG